MLGMKANQAADGSGTERFVLCDAAGHLQVDVLSGGGSTDVSGVATHAKQDTIIGHLDGVEGKLDAIETTNNACQVLLGTIDADTGAIKTAVEILDNAISGNEMQVDIVTSALPSGAATQTTLASVLAKNTEIETTADAILAKNTEIETTADAILSKNGEIETSLNSLISANHTDLVALEATLTEIAADGNAVQTKLDTIEASLTRIEPKEASSTYLNGGNVGNGNAISGTIVDTDGYRYMTVFAKATNSNQIVIQYSNSNNAGYMVSLPQTLNSTSINGIHVSHIVLEHPARYVRFVNFSGSTINALTLYYQLSN